MREISEKFQNFFIVVIRIYYDEIILFSCVCINTCSANYINFLHSYLLLNARILFCQTFVN